jgi:hypothetical protein
MLALSVSAFAVIGLAVRALVGLRFGLAVWPCVGFAGPLLFPAGLFSAPVGFWRRLCLSPFLHLRISTADYFGRLHGAGAYADLALMLQAGTA